MSTNVSTLPALDLDNPCTCGHVRGEHLTPTGSRATGQCLIVGCRCSQFKSAGEEAVDQRAASAAHA